MDTLETFRVYRATIPLSFLQILDLYTVFSRFYESLNEENWMCELCTFSQIRSHIRTLGIQNDTQMISRKVDQVMQISCDIIQNSF